MSINKKDTEVNHTNPIDPLRTAKYVADNITELDANASEEDIKLIIGNFKEMRDRAIANLKICETLVVDTSNAIEALEETLKLKAK